MQRFGRNGAQEGFGVSRTVRHLRLAVLVTQELSVLHLTLLAVDILGDEVDIQVLPCTNDLFRLLA